MRPTDIIEARERLGLTQSEVAHRARVSEQTVSRIERGIRVRPNSLKDVYAVLGLAYSQVDTTTLVMPERLLASASTEQMRQASVSLPNVEYLVRPDPQAWKSYVIGQFRANAFAASRRYPLIPFTAIMTLATIPFVIWASILAYGALAIGMAFFLIFSGFIAILNLISIAVLVFYGRELYRDYVACPDLDQAYAISEDAIWTLTATADRVDVKRTSLADVVWREVITDGPFMKIRVRQGEDVTEIERLPLHRGIVDLVDRQRPLDRNRVLDVSRPLTTTA